MPIASTCASTSMTTHSRDLIAEHPLCSRARRVADSQYHEMKSRIESMGPVNMITWEYNDRATVRLLSRGATCNPFPIPAGHCGTGSRVQTEQEAFAVINHNF
jgi:hypothetical protein